MDSDGQKASEIAGKYSSLEQYRDAFRIFLESKRIFVIPDIHQGIVSWSIQHLDKNGLMKSRLMTDGKWLGHSTVFMNLGNMILDYDSALICAVLASVSITLYN